MESNKHLTWAQRFCSQRECCAQELSQKLQVRGTDEKEIAQIIEKLTHSSFLDETRYVRAFVHDKSHLQGWGPQKIRFALRAKQIPDALIREALDSLDQCAQTEVLRRLLQVKRKTIKAKSATEMRTKLIRFALGRGFNYEQIINTITSQD
ncbi:MAG: recombination regulator RecX [Prevotellaceae bacterium]|jgi:regulatory protein|nr:recombination regulator RecX [Prevotellaceae bacterium]